MSKKSKNLEKLVGTNKWYKRNRTHQRKHQGNLMCLIVGENNANDILIVDKNLFTKSEEIQLQNYFENNLFEDDDKERYSMKKSY